MRVSRMGCTPVKGFHHSELGRLEIDDHGPVGDRDWCLVGPEGGRVLRSVAHPRLLGVRARWDGSELEFTLPDGSTAGGPPVPSGRGVRTDYWGRLVDAELHAGPQAELLSDFLGKPVRLARMPRGGVVYGAPVSLVTTASVADLAERMGRADVAGQPERFRSTVVVEASDAYVEDEWLGREVAIGDAVVRVRERIGRCGLVNLDPATGRSDAPVLKALAAYRPVNERGEPYLAVDAEVVRPGVIRPGDRVEVVAAR